MIRSPRLRKWLVIGIILLFIGVTVAPNINLTYAKKSSSNDPSEIATQAWHIKGFDDSFQENQNNSLCLVLGVVKDGYATGILDVIGMILQLLVIAGFPFLFALIGGIFIRISEMIDTFFPFSIMQGITLFSANIISLGLFGLKYHTIPPNSGTGKIFGFSGIKITNIVTKEILLFGFALAVVDLSND